ncbi:MAG: DUF1868 domain-containing protein [Nostocaceae cyanobacterium]|nr:DUF1868 domain-containing protein [Nostocaceae cyanobacterium]
MDDNYQTYLNRVARMTLPEAYKTQIQHIQESSKFYPTAEGTRQAAPFPGYTVITPPWEEQSQNSDFFAQLQDCQQQLLQILKDTNLIVPLPPGSFHLTLADLIWENAYLHAIEENPQFEENLRSCFAEIFQQYQESITSTQKPIHWQVLGFMIMPRAIGVSLVPANESSYQQIVNLRRVIYQNPKLIALGVEQQYHFTAHITLGYFGNISPTLNRETLCQKLSDLNLQWLENPPEINIHRAELRKFDDMVRYYRQPDWPSLDFE